MKKISLVTWILLTLSPAAFADWTLVGEESRIDYVSIKANSTGEVNYFKTLEGSITDSGAVSLTIDLNSVETGVSIRNERMQTEFFDTESFADAKVRGAVDVSRAVELQKGETYQEALKLTLSLHGVVADVDAQVQVTKLANDQLLVTSLSPVIIDAKTFDLGEGVEKLQTLAGLPSISSVVPVTFNLVFK
ncbi:YceI family protein [Neptunomonas phycophila]|uniref:YceI family protein n=1 Tax=Neptunomonas phycophila TaxID=1572645 RepID=UPI000949180F|nr:YceI family protein [Neptunomonas phycophila]